MLTSLQIKNFKGWKDTGNVRLAPLTVIFSANSAGKSSLGHLLLALKQTVLSADRKRPIQLGDDSTLIDLGTFAECLHNHDLKQSLEFELAWRLPQKLEVKDPVSGVKHASDSLKLKVSMKAAQLEQPRMEKIEYTLYLNERSSLMVDFSRDDKDKWDIHSSNYKFVRNLRQGDGSGYFCRFADDLALFWSLVFAWACGFFVRLERWFA